MSKNSIKWVLLVLLIICIGLGLCFVISKNGGDKKNKESNSNVLKELPKPELTGGQRGELGIDKNINESNIDEYLNRSDSVYRDMRMLEDPAKYESIGGDRFLSGYIKGFEVVPLPYIIPVTGLPNEVGKTYNGDTLFHVENGKFVANYEQSMDIIEKFFPKDKVIFLMCGGGGYAGMTKSFLVSLGWDENKIYNIGGFWYYEGKNKVEVKKNGTNYDFSDVPYHNIEFDKLTKSNNYKPNSIPVTGIKIDKNKVTIEEGKSAKVNVTLLPTNATNKNVKWISKNEKIATVKDGVISAKKVGTVKIVATTEDGNKSIICNVTVIEKRVVLSNTKKEKNEFDDIDTREGTWTGHQSCDFQKTSGCFKERTSEEEEKDVETAIKMKGEIINKLIKEKKSFVVHIHAGDTCIGYGNKSDSFDRHAQDYFIEKKLPLFTLGFAPFKKTLLYKTVKYNPAIIIVDKGKIYKYVDANMDEFTKLGKSKKSTVEWLQKYIVIK